MEQARGIEPSNRRRVGPEACLTGFHGGACSGRRTISPASADVTPLFLRVADPLARSPRRGRIPFETPRLEVREKDFLKVFIRRRNTITDN